MDEVSARQEQVLRCMRQAVIEHGLAPTLAEISACIGISVSTVHHHVQRLLRQGLVRQERAYQRRGYRPL
ncbi:LexA family protein [Streptomyces albus]|uniref:LexA family protein n=1 Tax=Streptomyces albus TaxID=1888 RepID=UPI003F1E1FC9